MLNERTFYNLMLHLPPALQGMLFADQYHIVGMVRRAAAAAKPGQRVLDAGAGEGRYAPLFRHVSYMGVDYAVGDSKYDYSHLDAIADVQRLPLANDSFDTVINVEVFEHVPDPAAAIAELYRVLKPGGTLYLSTPLALWVHQQPHHFFQFSPYALRMLFDRAGFEVESIEPRGGFFHHISYYLSYSSSLFYPAFRKWWGMLLLPLFVLNVLLTGVLLPTVLFWLDWLDVEKRCTTGFTCCVRKPEPKPATATTHHRRISAAA